MSEQTMPTKKEQQVQKTREELQYAVPPVEIYETEEDLKVIADLPGVNKEDIAVNINDNILTFEGKTKHIFPDNVNILYEEYNLPSFYRQFEIGETIDQEKISAELKNGVLNITLPKAEAAKPKQISVKVS